MNARERFNRIMRFQRPDRVPLWQAEHLTEGAVRKWICDGDVPLGVRRQDVVRFDPCTIVRLDTAPLPAFVGRTIDEDDRWITSIDPYGFTVRASKDQAVGPTVYYYLAGSVRGRADWEEMKKRFEPADPRRKPREWSHELIEQHNRSDGPVGLWIDWGPGRGIKNGYMLGMEAFLDKLTSQPELIADMFEFWADFVIEAAREWVGSVRFDFALFNEDGMAFKNSTMVSPQTYRRLWGPPVRRVTDFLRAGGVEVIGYLTSGNIRPLIPVLLDLGVNLHAPLECAAGLDARELRRQFPELLMIGNISRQSLMDGPAAVEAEFRAKVPPLMEAGGYVPAVDDMILPDIPYASYRRYAELVRECRL